MDKSVSGQSRITDPELLSAVIDALPLPIFVKDENSVFVLSNRRHGELVHLGENDLVGNTTARLVGEEEAIASRERDLPVLETGEESIVRRDYAFSKESSCYLETRKTRLVDAEGRRFVLGVNVDFTEVRQRESHLRAVTEAVPVGIVEIREGAGVIFANKLAYTHLGFTSQDRPFEEIEQLLSSGGREGFPGKRTSFEMSVDGATGADKRLLIMSSGWTDIPHMRERTAIVSILDLSEVTELRRENDEVSRLNTELAEKMRDLRQAQEELISKGKLEQLGQLTATIAHELRNPLGAVRTTAFLLQRKLAAQNPGTEKQFERIGAGIVRCDAIITQLLDYARTKKLDQKPLSLDSWLKDLLEDECKSLPETVDVVFEQGIGEKLVHFDADRMRRAIINVLSNAVEAMVGKGGQDPVPAGKSARILIESRISSRGCEIEVADTGPGMAPEVLARIREPLFTTKNFGTGLGIPAVERILEQHDGGIDVWSRAGEGTKITLWWPMASEA